MRVRSFKVPFSKVVGEEAYEVEYGPDDAMVVRPLFGLPAGKAQEWAKRIDQLHRQSVDAQASGEQSDIDAAGEAVAQIVLDLLRELVTDWRLEGPDGPILKPAKGEDLDALPLTLRNALFGFFQTYRGDGPPNPTTSG